ncbi:MAG: hypothetical protein ABRQ37_11270 [Candidatus Eremiobacterota bacterium]
MQCQLCGELIDEYSINRKTFIASCPNCDSVFNFSTIPDAVDENAPGRRSPVAMPAGITMENGDGHLVIKWRWFRQSSFLLIIITLLYDCGLIYLLFLSHSHIIALAGFLMKFLFYGLVPFILTFIAMAHAVNSTVFDISDEAISIRHKPLPWPGNQTICSANISQLYCKKDKTRTVLGQDYSFCLKCIMKDGEEKDMIGYLDTPEQAIFIEQEIEKLLDIKDEAVGDVNPCPVGLLIARILPGDFHQK